MLQIWCHSIAVIKAFLPEGRNDYNLLFCMTSDFALQLTVNQSPKAGRFLILNYKIGSTNRMLWILKPSLDTFDVEGFCVHPGDAEG